MGASFEPSVSSQKEIILPRDVRACHPCRARTRRSACCPMTPPRGCRGRRRQPNPRRSTSSRFPGRAARNSRHQISRRIGADGAIRRHVWQSSGLLRLSPAWNGTNRLRLRAGSILASRALRSRLISDVDRPQERLIVICKDECASRVAITRGLLVRS